MALAGFHDRDQHSSLGRDVIAVIRTFWAELAIYVLSGRCPALNNSSRNILSGGVLGYVSLVVACGRLVLGSESYFQKDRYNSEYGI